MWTENGNVQDWGAKFSGKPMVWGDTSAKMFDWGTVKVSFA